MTRDEALEAMWAAKDWRNPTREEAFFLADLVEDVKMMLDKSEKTRTVKSGTTVLVTMVSRFGDVGIRDNRLSPPSHGYYARVDPMELTNWRRAT